MESPEGKPAWFKRTITKPATQFEHDAVEHVQRVLRCPVNGEMDDVTVSHLRGLQQLFGLRATGQLDEATARQIERIRSYGSV